jgi:hypothetical protein
MPTPVIDGLPWPVVLLVGTLCGLIWGIDARLWMRFISTDPDFTWSGTLFIVLGFGVVGLSQSGAYLGRRAGLTYPWMTILSVFTFMGLLPLGLAAGGPMFPTVVLAPLALTHTEWLAPVRVIVAALALVPVVFIAASLFKDLAPARAVVGALWFFVVYAGLVWAARFTLAPWRAGRRAAPRGLYGRQQG